MTSVAVQGSNGSVSLRLLDLTSEGVFLSEDPSLIEVEVVACVHDVFTDC